MSDDPGEDSGDDVNTPTDIVDKDDGIRLTDGNTTLQLEKASVQVENHAPLSLFVNGSITGIWFKLKNAWLFQELVALLKLAIPMILALILQQTWTLISLAFVGHGSSNSSISVDATGLGISFFNINGLSVAIGLASAADTLCAQAYGYKNYKRVGVIFQRGLLILLTMSLFIWSVMLNTESITLLLQQPPCVARYASIFVRILSSALPFSYLFVMLQKYLQTQGIVWPFILIGVISNIICVILHAILVMAVRLGIVGASISLVLTNMSAPLLLILYVRVRKLHQKTWGGWSWESFRGWGQFLKLGISGMIMLCMEWVSFEISTFVVGSLGEVPLAANIVVLNTLIVAFMIPLGVSISVSVRVGNELGAGNPKGAKRAAYVSCGVVIINALICIIILESLGDKLGKFYGVEDDVRAVLRSLIHFVCGQLIFDHLKGVISGIIRGAGHQLRGAVINFISYYVFGLPIGISFALATDLGITGMWIGLLIGNVTQCILYTIVLCSMNWEKDSERAMKIASTGIEKSEIDKEGETEVNQDAIGSEANEFALQAYNPVSHEDREESDDDSVSNDDDIGLLVFNEPRLHQDSSIRWKIKSVLSHGAVVVVGIGLLVGGGIASQYRPPDSVIHGNYSECIS